MSKIIEVAITMIGWMSSILSEDFFKKRYNEFNQYYTETIMSQPMIMEAVKG